MQGFVGENPAGFLIGEGGEKCGVPADFTAVGAGGRAGIGGEDVAEPHGECAVEREARKEIVAGAVEFERDGGGVHTVNVATIEN